MLQIDIQSDILLTTPSTATDCGFLVSQSTLDNRVGHWKGTVEERGKPTDHYFSLLAESILLAVIIALLPILLSGSFMLLSKSIILGYNLSHNYDNVVLRFDCRCWIATSFFPKSPPGFIVETTLKCSAAKIVSTSCWEEPLLLPFSARTRVLSGSSTLFSRSRTESSAREISSHKNMAPSFMARTRGPSDHSNSFVTFPSWKVRALKCWSFHDNTSLALKHHLKMCYFYQDLCVSASPP